MQNKLLLKMFGLTLALAVFSPMASAQLARVPLKDDVGIPANDLLYKGEVLTPERARSIERQKGEHFLSTLEPVVQQRGVWENIMPEQLDESLDNMPINGGDKVRFQSTIKSNGGFFKFNVITDRNAFVTIYLDKKLHTTLIRKNLLRKLGYVVPAIKYLPTLKVTFRTEKEKENFLSKLLRGAEGKTDRWVDEERSSGLTLHLRDVAAQELNDTLLYNYAMGVQNGALNNRTVRSLVVPYAVADIKESVNKVPWHVGRKGEGERLELPHFVINNNFQTTTYNDVLWMAKRMAKLERSDYEEIVKKAYFPRAAEALIVEKMISRAKSLFETLNISFDQSEYDYDSNVSEAPYLLGGKINKRRWKDHGYASEFAAGDATSPFKDFRYYVYSILQSIAIDSGVSELNSKLRAFDPNDARMDLAKKEFEEGLDHFVQTGEFMEFPVSSWTSPVVNGDLVLSRDVVVGNYLGTENLVQLADTFGYAVTLGAMMGLENVDFADQVTFTATASYVKTFTHLKPLKSLKDVFKEEYKNMIVPLLKKNLRFHLEQAIANNETDEPRSADEDLEFLGNVVKDISKVLGVGESLIITEKIVPKLGGKGRIPLDNTGFTLGLGLSAKAVGIKRLQVLRKDAKTIQIYDDQGFGKGIDFTIDLEHVIPVVRFEYRTLKGEYQVKSFMVNIEADRNKNPHFIEGVAGLNSILTSGSSEVLEELAEKKKNIVSSQVDGKFSDKYSKFAFLFWRRQSNKGFSHYDVKTSGGLKGEYVTYHDTARSGLNWESFTKDIIQYGLSKMSDGSKLKWANQIWGNPANSIMGSAEVLETEYQAQIKENKIKKEYISLALRFEGWSEGKSDILEIMDELNKKFTFDIFKPAQVEKIAKLYMYDIHAKVNIYQGGVDALKNVSRETLIRYANYHDGQKAKEGRGCHPDFIREYRVKGVRGKIATCGTMRTAIHNINKCSKYTERKEETACWTKVAKDIFRSIPFNYFVGIIGEQNYYLEGEVNGFRQNSEILNTPIKSHGYGRKHPGYPYGLMRKIQQRVGIQKGEFTGQWLRERP